MKKAIARFLMWLSNWSLDETIPEEAKRSIMIAAPHTTNWDGYYLILAFILLDIPMRFTIKEFWTKFPFGLLVKPLGGLGINRKPRVAGEPHLSYIEQMAGFFKTHDEIAMVVAAEGTRALRKEWKLGFYHTALKAKVPITLGYLDFEKKLAGVSSIVVYPTGDPEVDLPKIMDFYAGIAPKYPAKFSPDIRYWQKKAPGNNPEASE